MKDLPESIQTVAEEIERYRKLNRKLGEVKKLLLNEEPNKVRFSNSKYDNVEIDDEHLYLFIDTLKAYEEKLEKYIKTTEEHFKSFTK